MTDLFVQMQQQQLDRAIDASGLKDTRWDVSCYGRSRAWRAARATLARLLLDGWQLDEIATLRDDAWLHHLYQHLSDGHNALVEDDHGMFFEVVETLIQRNFCFQPQPDEIVLATME